MMMVGVISVASSQDDEKVRLIWLGLIPGDLPAIEKRLDRCLGDAISSDPSAEMVDQVTAKRLANRTNFAEHPEVTDRFIQDAAGIMNARTLVVWARATSQRDAVKRKYVVATRADKELTVSLCYYDINAKAFQFNGDIHAVASVKKDPAMFQRGTLVTHVSVEDQVALDDQLIADIQRQASDINSGIVHAQINRNKNATPTATTPDKVQSATDLFNLPTDAAKDLKSASPADSAKAGKTPAAGKSNSSGKTDSTTTHP